MGLIRLIIFGFLFYFVVKMFKGFVRILGIDSLRSDLERVRFGLVEVFKVSVLDVFILQIQRFFPLCFPRHFRRIFS